MLNQKIKELDALHSESKKIVKIEMDKSTWKEFGIQDKMQAAIKEQELGISNFLKDRPDESG